MVENLRETLLGGQCFSWTEEEPGLFTAVLNEKVYRIRSLEDARNDEYLRAYFDLDYDYEKAMREISEKDEILKQAVSKIGMLRMLKQDHFIATISFILSQNNNIKRIKGLYDRFSRTFGHEVEPGYFSFPTKDELKGVCADDYRALGCGFRAPFLVDAVDKADMLESVENMDFDTAMEALQTIKGIGPKVASCILIFSYQKREGFPMDVWMKKVMAEYYPGKDSSYFAPYQALSQQYLFSWIRSME